jgi:5-methylcytosine-specific restriction endonuclease McrA
MRNLKPRIATLAPRLGYASDDRAAESRYRRARDPALGWYKSARWQRIRWQVLVRDRFQCQACKRTIAGKGEAICDHVVPHRGNASLFWSGPFQTLCKQCHDSVKQREEREMQR